MEGVPTIGRILFLLLAGFAAGAVIHGLRYDAPSFATWGETIIGVLFFGMAVMPR